uniref:LEM domain-containing protein n=1 Tax=Ascaris lumbricoides TaxID=6252 RepID=A0A0M3I6J9_ASCLU
MADIDKASSTMFYSFKSRENMIASFENEPDNNSIAANIIHANNNGSVDTDSTTIPCKRTSISYGFASSSNYTHLKALSPCESDALTNDEVNDEECERKFLEDETTSEPLFNADSGAENLPTNCRRLTGAQADKFLQNLPLRHSEHLRKFVEANEPTESEHYVWIRNNTTSQVLHSFNTFRRFPVVLKFLEDETTSEPLFNADSGAENLPTNCRRLTGAQADKFLQNLPLRHSEHLRKFVEANEPTESEHYVWIRNNTTSQITLLSLQTVLNYMKNTSLVKRVKWRHLSFDRITVYRYSVPSIASTKEPIHLLPCLVKHQRYLLLILWLTIILLLISSIIFGTLYSSNNATNSTQTTLNFSQYFTRY